MIKKPTTHYDVIVVGGGASGLMAAGTAASRGRRVLILEKNPQLGKKLKITGGGRCNVTNAEEDIHALLKNYGKAAPYLYSPFSQFGMKDTFTFFESRGLPLVVEARKRAFPHTQKAIDVYNVMERYIKSGNVAVVYKATVSKVNIHENKVASVTAGKETYSADSFVFATGGVSHPETGSTGDGFKWLKDLGHSVETPTPNIVPLAVADEWIKSLAGVSLSFMKITFYSEGKKSFSKTGKILFTHFGLSGPLILNSANAVKDLLYCGEVTARIDAYPDTDEGVLEAKIIKVFDAHKNKALKNVMKEIVPDGTAPAIIGLLDIDVDTKVHSVTKEDRKKIVKLLKSLPVLITGLMGYDRAVVSDGGVTLDEMNMKTMRSTLYPNLYLTGDLLHISRPSGGYSLQICWTTGYVAGMNA